jgi:hypothetical protein
MMAATMSLAAADSGLWKVRALTLASEKRLIGAARLLWTTVYGREVWTVPSRAHKGELHQVTVDTTSGRIHCDCPSRSACSHQGAVLHAARMREQATRAMQSEQDWRRECDMGGALMDAGRGWN